jgi:hypothetical protein
MSGAGRFLLGTVGQGGGIPSKFHSAVIAASSPAAPTPPLQGVPSLAYLWIPVSVGAGLALLLIVLVGSFGIPYRDGEAALNVKLFGAKFWRARFYASAAWTFNDSGVTNITASAAAVTAILASGTVLTSVFSKIDLSPFIIMNIACGGLVAVAPIVFGIINFFVMRTSPLVPADASLALQAGATITLPGGASLGLAGGATVIDAAGGVQARIKPGGTVPVPPGSVLTFAANAVMAMPSGSALVVGPGATLTISADTRVAAGDLEPPPVPAIAAQIKAGDQIVATEGATATVLGTADIDLNAVTTVMAPGRRAMTLPAHTMLTVPCGNTVMTAGMGSVLPAAVLTTFAAGAEIGLVAVLAGHYSPAGHIAHAWAIAIAAVVAAGLLVYGVTSVRSLAEPTSGTALTSGASTSFTI